MQETEKIQEEAHGSSELYKNNDNEHLHLNSSELLNKRIFEIEPRYTDSLVVVLQRIIMHNRLLFGQKYINVLQWIKGAMDQ